MAVLWAHMYDQPPSLAAARPDLAVTTDVVLARALAKDPEDRYATCAAFIDALGAALSAPARPDSRATRRGNGSAPAAAASWPPRPRDREAQPPPRRTESAPQPATLDSPAPVLVGPPWEPLHKSPSGQSAVSVPSAPSVPPAAPATQAGPLSWPEPLLRRWRQLAGHGDHRTRRGDYEEDGDHERRGKRRWPVVSTALVLLVLLVGGGGYGFWRYDQSQYYVGEQDGFVAIFGGTNHNLAGISMSSLIQRTTLPVSQLTSGDQNLVTQTISQGSKNSAQLIVDQLQTHASDCHQQWQALATWQTKNATYQRELAAAAGTKAKVRASDEPGPGADARRPGLRTAAAFGIPASALPTAQASATPAITPSPAAA